MLVVLVLACIFMQMANGTNTENQIRNNTLEIITRFYTDITLACKSSDPIDWDYQWFSPLKLRSTDFDLITKQRLLKSTGKGGTDVEFESSIKIGEYFKYNRFFGTSSLKFICRSLRNPKNLRFIFVSFPTFPFSSNQTKIKVANEIIIYPRLDEDIFQIPCNFSYFEKEPKPSLLKLANGIRTNVTEQDDVLPFDPSLGFTIRNLKDNSQVGDYECVLVYKNRFTLYVPLKVGFMPDSLYSPMKNRLSFGDKLFCTSTHPIQMKDEKGRPLNGVKYTANPIITTSTYNYNATARMNDHAAACFKNKTNELIKLWKLGFAEPVSARLDNNDRIDALECFRSEIEYIGCNEPSECKSRLHDFKKGILHTGGQFPNASSQTVILARKPIWARCVLEDSYSNVDVFLLDLDRAYFVYNVESDLRNMSDKLVRIDQKVQHEAYQNERIQFTCTTIRYLFAQPHWAFRYKNGTTLLQSSSLKENVFENQGFTQRLTTTLEINSQDIAAVECYAPFYNFYDWLHATHNLIIYGRNPPTVVDSKRINKVETSPDGQKDLRLTCEAEGYPEPNITWQWDINIEGINAEELITTEGKRKISVLVVSDANSTKKENDYICSASNIFGTTKKTFRTYISSSIHPGIIAAISICSILAIVAVITNIWWQRRNLERIQNMLTEKDRKQFLQGDPQSPETEASPSSIPFPEKFQIHRDSFSFHVSKVLGSGAYGIVYQGIFNPNKRDDYIQVEYGIEDKIVAIKTVKKDADVEYIRSLLKEIKTMAYSGSHANIVTFIGACVQNMLQNEVYAILEFCANGSLEGYLRKHRSEFLSLDTTDLESMENQMTPKQLLQWSKDIASGMSHLAEKNIIHGDLATRNVLLSNDLIGKVSDFGLSKQLYTCSEYKRKPDVKLPWAWLAIESLRDLEFSLQSDVWAFGVTVWEIFSLAHIPYGGLGFTFEFINMLELGLRLPKPSCASDQLHKIMLACWNNSADKRPRIRSILTMLEEVQVESSCLDFRGRNDADPVTTPSSSYSQSSYI